MIFSCYCRLIHNYEFYYISVVTETMVIKKRKKQIIPMPPLEAPSTPLGGHAPQFKNHCPRETVAFLYSETIR